MTTLSTPKYIRAKRKMLDMLESGRFSPGEMFPSEAQLTRRLNVSRPTLIRSIQDLVRDGYLVRKQGLGTFVADRDGVNESELQTVPLIIAMSITDKQGDDRFILDAILDGLKDGLRAHNCKLDVKSIGSDFSTDLPDDLVQWDSFFETSQTPLLVYPFGLPCADWWLPKLQNRRPWIIGQPVAHQHCVYIDEEEAGYLATKYLIDSGRERVAMISSNGDGYWGLAARQQGYARAIKEAGLTLDPELKWIGEHILESESGRAGVRQFLKSKTKFDGVFGASDRRAVGAVEALMEAGLNVPEDVGVVAMDDTIASRATPPLSAVHLPFYEMGRIAAVHAASPELAEAHRRTASRIALMPELVDRGSGCQ